MRMIGAQRILGQIDTKYNIGNHHGALILRQSWQCTRFLKMQCDIILKMAL